LEGRWKVGSEEEKRITDFYKGELKAKKGKDHKLNLSERIALSDEVGLTLGRAVQATASTATQVLETYGDALEPAQVRRLREIEHAPAAISDVSAEEGLITIVEGVAELVSILGSILDGQKQGQRETRVITLVGWVIAVIIGLVGWVIAIIAIVVQVIT